MEFENHEKSVARLLGAIGGLTVALGLVFAQDFVKGMGLIICLIGLILAVRVWRRNRGS